MSLSTESLILSRSEYQQRRASDRARVMALRAARRVRVGDTLVLAFENAETLQYQVQEMVYAEGITDRALAEHEVEAYSRLLPTESQLCATLFIELTDEDTIREELARLRGVHRAIRMHVGDVTIEAAEIPGPDEDEPSELTYSVHFLRFAFDAEQRAAFRDVSVPVTIEVEHPAYQALAPVEGETRESLAADLG